MPSIAEFPLRLRSFVLRQPIINSKLLPNMPRSVRWGLRKVYFLPYDLLDRLTGQQDELTPPKSWIYDGGVDGYKRGGQFVLRQLIEMDGLEPDEAVLDVGCGLGRQAVALTGFLSAAGRYDGLDIVPHGIRWCSEHVASRYPNFHFHLANIFNQEYNPTGRLRAAEYTFPFDDETFDLAFLTSVFTHMLPDDVEHYIAEIARVLKPGGRCHATFFLLNQESRELMAAGRSVISFKGDFGVYRTANPQVPEYSVAYDEDFILERFQRHGLSPRRPVFHGGWDGRAGTPKLNQQDIIVAGKAA